MHIVDSVKGLEFKKLVHSKRYFGCLQGRLWPKHQELISNQPFILKTFKDSLFHALAFRFIVCVLPLNCTYQLMKTDLAISSKSKLHQASQYIAHNVPVQEP